MFKPQSPKADQTLSGEVCHELHRNLLCYAGTEKQPITSLQDYLNTLYRLLLRPISPKKPDGNP